MRLYEYARENGLDTNAVSAAAEALGFDKTSATSGVSEAEEQQLNDYFKKLEEEEDSDEEQETDSNTESGSDVETPEEADSQIGESVTQVEESAPEIEGEVDAPSEAELPSGEATTTGEEPDPENTETENTSDAPVENEASTDVSDLENINDTPESDQEPKDNIKDDSEPVYQFTVSEIETAIDEAKAQGGQLVLTREGFEFQQLERPTHPIVFGDGKVGLPEFIEPPTKYYCPRHLEVRLKGPQVSTLKTLMYSLQCAGVDIQRGPDVIRWLIDQVTPLIEDQNQAA